MQTTLLRGLAAAPLCAAGLATAVSAQPQCDYMPTAAEVILDTDFTQIQPVGKPPRGVSGGVFIFRNVTIPAGTTVRGTGSRPMVWIVTGDFVVNGALRVDGSDGDRVNTLQSANFPTAGGVGNCGGGNGGLGSPSVTGPSLRGQYGFGPGSAANLGGAGGWLSCTSDCGRGSGGGGGAFATQGDPWYPVKANGTSFVQVLGQGGYGCMGFSGSSQRFLPGGAAGPVGFTDSDPDNNFFGTGYDVAQGRVIPGELAAPIGGAGGGGGGDRSTFCGPIGNWISNNKGGGGGGGGGALVILAAGKIEVGPQGIISANGGNGGGGEQAGSNNQGAGGGGGAGGMVVLYSLGRIVLHAHGETYALADYSFAVSADGGISTQGLFSGLAIDGKYPPPSSASMWDRNPTGGFGGMGVVQLMARPGTNQDGTNTILDDSIDIVLPGGALANGVTKTRYLAWRGYRNASGVLVDDQNRPTYAASPATADDEGDIRPAPVLLPIL